MVFGPFRRPPRSSSRALRFGESPLPVLHKLGDFYRPPWRAVFVSPALIGRCRVASSYDNAFPPVGVSLADLSRRRGRNLFRDVPSIKGPRRLCCPGEPVAVFFLHRRPTGSAPGGKKSPEVSSSRRLERLDATLAPGVNFLFCRCSPAATEPVQKKVCRSARSIVTTTLLLHRYRPYRGKVSVVV